MSSTRLAAFSAICLGTTACADVSGLSAYSTNCVDGCAGPAADAGVIDASIENVSVDTSDASGTPDVTDQPDTADEVDALGMLDAPDAPNAPDADNADANNVFDGPDTSSPTTWLCSKGGCNSAGGACSASSGCYCTADAQCKSGKCVKVATHNDLSCTTCTGAGPVDGFDCQLGSPGIPATCAAAFGYTPSNFTPASYPPPSTATTIDCSTTYNSTTHAFTGWCAGRTQPTVTSGVSQTGGPKFDVLSFAGLTIASGGTLMVTGDNAVVLAVYGDATVSGSIDADGVGGAPNSSTPGASGPGGNYSCGSHAGQDSGDSNDDGGGGGGASANGGAGANGSNGTGGVAGTSRDNTTLSPLYGGCPGGASGSWGCTTSGGGGGGAVQLSAAGALSVTGTIRANGGAGGTSTCSARQNICGTTYPGAGGGGGSGGAILLEGQSVTTSGGSVTVTGGAGGNPNVSGSGAGAGGAGGTSGSPVGQDGTGSSGPCGNANQAAGGGGGGYGYLTVNGSKQAAAYSCPTTLAPGPVCNAGHSACVCIADSDCATGKCLSTAQCTGTCTGTGSADVTGCASLSSSPQ